MAAIFGRRRRIRAAYEALCAAMAAADGASGAAAERARRRHLEALVELWLREEGIDGAAADPALRGLLTNPEFARVVRAVEADRSASARRPAEALPELDELVAAARPPAPRGRPTTGSASTARTTASATSRRCGASGPGAWAPRARRSRSRCRCSTSRTCRSASTPRPAPPALGLVENLLMRVVSHFRPGLVALHLWDVEHLTGPLPEPAPAHPHRPPARARPHRAAAPARRAGRPHPPRAQQGARRRRGDPRGVHPPRRRPADGAVGRRGARGQPPAAARGGPPRARPHRPRRARVRRAADPARRAHGDRRAGRDHRHRRPRRRPHLDDRPLRAGHAGGAVPGGPGEHRLPRHRGRARELARPGQHVRRPPAEPRRVGREGLDRRAARPGRVRRSGHGRPRPRRRLAARVDRRPQRLRQDQPAAGVDRGARHPVQAGRARAVPARLQGERLVRPAGPRRRRHGVPAARAADRAQRQRRPRVRPGAAAVPLRRDAPPGGRSQEVPGHQAGGPARVRPARASGRGSSP